jgi:chromosome segregation protein
LFLKYIEIQGFKSFAEPVTIEFRDGITCIVGPNGSGKSNISDAVRWVLGEQSSKTLRGGKMEEVIFAGTTNRKSRGMAEVTLVIDNKNKVLPIDYSEVAITRRAYRSGESEYLINKVQCRLRDIRNLIMDTGIGVDGYTIIGQGKIGDIVNNKPESRREVFEEAAGIVKYRHKKAQAEGKMANCKSNLNRVNDIISEIEGRIHGLRHDSEKAEKYLSLKERYRNLEIGILLKNIEGLDKKSKQIEEDLHLFHAETLKYRDEKEKVLIELSVMQDEKNRLEEWGRNGQDQLSSVERELNDLLIAKRLNEEKAATIDKDYIRIQGEILEVNERLATEKKKEKEVKAKREELAGEIEKHRLSLEDKNQRYGELTVRMEEALAGMESRRDEISILHNSIAMKEAGIKSLEVITKAISERKNKVIQEKVSHDNSLIQLRESLEKTKGEKGYKEKGLAETDACMINLIKSHGEKTAGLAKLTDKLETAKVRLGQTLAMKDALENMESSYQGYNQGIKFIMREGIPGIHGVVAKLITAMDGYETAIEAALGAKMQNLVCIDEDCAKEAVARLKESKAGRLTFLPLSIGAAGVHNKDEIIRTDGFKGFAQEHITYDNVYKNVMEYLLNGVVVLEDLKSAIEFSKVNRGRYRIVTLEGELINPWGAITGGRGKDEAMGFLRRKSELKRLLSLSAKIQSEIAEMDDKCQKIKAEISKIEGQKGEMEVRHRKEEREILILNNEIKGISVRINEIISTKNLLEKELDEIDLKELESKKEIESLKKHVESEKKSISDFKAIAESVFASYEGLKTRVAEAGEELTDIRLILGRAEAERESAERDCEAARKSIGDLEDDRVRKNNALEVLDREKNGIIQASSEVGNSIETLRIKEQELKDRLGEIQKRIVQTEVSFIESMKKKEELEGVLFEQERQKHEVEIGLVKNSTVIEGYKDRLWDDYEMSLLQAEECVPEDFVMSKAIKESRELKGRIQDLGDINVGAIEEYARIKKRYDFLIRHRDDLINSVESLEAIIKEMDKTIRNSFNNSFYQIEGNFKESFKKLFGGGYAELKLEDEDNPLESGITIIAQPPGKKLQNINLLSGGEKALTGIALMFAVLKARPAPFCILDEVEAALDDANIDRMINHLKDFKDIQFALITHQKATMEQADILYGVTMAEQGVSKVISLQVGEEFQIQ